MRRWLIAPLLSASLLGCAPFEPLDHHWGADRCVVEIESQIAWDPMSSTRKPRAEVYLRRAHGMSALVIDLGAFVRSGEAFHGSTTIRFAVSPDAQPGASLSLQIDASDIRGPAVLEPGAAWLIATTRNEDAKPQDGWLFGSGSLKVSSLSFTEHDTDARDEMTVDATFDLSEVTAAPLTPEQDAPSTEMSAFAGRVHVRCVDEGTPMIEPLDEGAGGSGAGAAGSAGEAGVGGSGGSTAPIACGQPESCSLSTCADCNGDAADFCETDLTASESCGACGRTCGPSGTCDALGACAGEVLSQSQSVRSIGAGAAGVAWIDASSSASVGFWSAAGLMTIPAPGNYSLQDSIVVSDAELFWASYAGISRVQTSTGVVTAVASSIVPDGIRLLGVTPAWVYVTMMDAASTGYSIQRIDRAGVMGSETAACLPLSMYDAAFHAGSNSVLVSLGDRLMRYDGAATVGACTANTPGTALLEMPAGESIMRVVADGSSAAIVVSTAGGYEVRRVSLSGGSAQVLGAAATFSAFGQQAFPLAMAGDEIFWVQPAADGSLQHRLLSASPSGKTSAVAITSSTVVGLGVNGANVAWADAAGVFRVPR